MSINIEGIGVLGGFGVGFEDLKNAYEKKQVIPSRVSISSDKDNLEGYAYLADTNDLNDFFQKRVLRRITHFSRMALLGASLALKDANLKKDEIKDIGIIVASAYGDTSTNFKFLDFVQDYGDEGVSPLLFSNSVHNSATSNISIHLSIEGPCTTICQQEFSTVSALITAKNWLDEGRVSKVLFGVVDQYHPVLGYCFKRYFGKNARRIDTYNLDEQSAVPGEGSVFFVLSKKENNSSIYNKKIESISLGRDDESFLNIDKNALLISGFDGHKSKGKFYKKYLNIPKETINFSDIYGAIPVSQAFDMAISLLLDSSYDKYQLLKFDCNSCYGLINLCKK